MTNSLLTVLASLARGPVPLPPKRSTKIPRAESVTGGPRHFDLLGGFGCWPRSASSRRPQGNCGDGDITRRNRRRRRGSVTLILFGSFVVLV